MMITAMLMTIMMMTRKEEEKWINSGGGRKEKAKRSCVMLAFSFGSFQQKLLTSVHASYHIFLFFTSLLTPAVVDASLNFTQVNLTCLSSLTDCIHTWVCGWTNVNSSGVPLQLGNVCIPDYNIAYLYLFLFYFTASFFRFSLKTQVVIFFLERRKRCDVWGSARNYYDNDDHHEDDSDGASDGDEDLVLLLVKRWIFFLRDERSESVSFSPSSPFLILTALQLLLHMCVMIMMMIMIHGVAGQSWHYYRCFLRCRKETKTKKNLSPSHGQQTA